MKLGKFFIEREEWGGELREAREIVKELALQAAHLGSIPGTLFGYPELFGK